MNQAIIDEAGGTDGGDALERTLDAAMTRFDDLLKERLQDLEARLTTNFQKEINKVQKEITKVQKSLGKQEKMSESMSRELHSLSCHVYKVRLPCLALHLTHPTHLSRNII